MVFGSVSLMGIFSILLFILLVIDCIRVRAFFPSKDIQSFRIMLLFNIFASIMLLFKDINQYSLQIILCYWCFYFSILIGQGFSEDYFKKIIQTLFPWVLIFVSIIYILATFFFSVGNSELYGNRTIGIALSIGACCMTPFVKDENLLYKIGFILIVLTVLLSKSRTGSAVVILFLLIAFSLGRKKIHKTKLITLTALTIFLIMIYLRSSVETYKWFFGGDTAIRYGNVTISSQGRIEMWRFMLNSALDSKLFGHGPGSVRGLLNSYYFSTQEPHNEFIRVFYELGYVGLGLFVMSLLSICFALIKSYFFERRNLLAPSSLLGILGILSLFAYSLTDNPMAYVFYISPLGLILGGSLRNSKSFVEGEKGSTSN